MAGCEQHAGDRQHQIVPGLVQLVETVANDGGGKLQKTALDLVLRQSFAQTPSDGVEFRHRILVTTAVTADHDPDFAHLVRSLSW